jgi:hypothetical protein
MMAALEALDKLKKWEKLWKRADRSKWVPSSRVSKRRKRRILIKSNTSKMTTRLRKGMRNMMTMAIVDPSLSLSPKRI